MIDRPRTIATPGKSLPHSRLLATMTHELRTPLNVVIGSSEAIMREPGSAMTRQQIVEHAGSINEAGRQLLALIDSILDAAKVEAGQFDLPADLMDITQLVASVVAGNLDSAHRSDLELLGAASAGALLLRGDETRIRNAMGHLVANAIKFTPAGGSIRVAAKLEEPSGDLLLMVSDTGIGIVESDLLRAFEPFVQLDASLARRFPGTGLGLYISQITAHAHGGDLILSSEPGVGTTAVLRLPAYRLVDPPSGVLP